MDNIFEGKLEYMNNNQEMTFKDLYDYVMDEYETYKKEGMLDG